MLRRIEKVVFSTKDKENFESVENFLKEIIDASKDDKIATPTLLLYRQLLNWEIEMGFEESEE